MFCEMCFFKDSFFLCIYFCAKDNRLDSFLHPDSSWIMNLCLKYDPHAGWLQGDTNAVLQGMIYSPTILHDKILTPSLRRP